MLPLIQMTLRHEDGDDETQLPPSARKDRRRASVGTTNERRGLERRRSRRHSLQNSRGHASAPASPSSPHPHANSFLPFGGQRIEDISERWGRLRLVSFIRLTNWSWDLQGCDGFTGNSLTQVGFRISALEGVEKSLIFLIVRHILIPLIEIGIFFQLMTWVISCIFQLLQQELNICFASKRKLWPYQLRETTIGNGGKELISVLLNYMVFFPPLKYLEIFDRTFFFFQFIHQKKLES